MPLDALVFDAYGTLFDVHAVIQRCEVFWPGHGTRLSQTWRAKQLEYTWLRSLMNRYAPFSTVTRDALAYACEALGLVLDQQKAEALMEEYRRLAPYPDVPATLERLSGRKLAVLTNGSPDMIDPLVAAHGMAGLFDAVLSVDAIRLYKPAPAVYELAGRQLEMASERIGFISSNCWDALGAKSYGFRVFWINRTSAPADRLGFAPDGILKSLSELPGRL
jgi:2-haloacid dehalogenase